MALKQNGAAAAAVTAEKSVTALGKLRKKLSLSGKGGSLKKADHNHDGDHQKLSDHHHDCEVRSVASAESPADVAAAEEVGTSSSIACGDDIKKVFEYFDEDGDGKVSPAELQRCVRVVGGELSAEEAEMAVRLSDSDGDGMLGYEDFARMMKVEGGEGEEDQERQLNEELKEAFGMYEMKGSGCITPKSLKRMLSKLGNSTSIENCKAMIERYDLNGDGVLNFDEFKLMMKS